MLTMQDYQDFLARLREVSGIEEFMPDADGLVSVTVNEKYTLNLQYIEGTGNVLCFVEVTTLSEQTSKEVYRELLSGGLFGQETAGGYFSLEPESETVVYNYMFSEPHYFENVEDFIDVLEKIVELCDMWVERIANIENVKAEEEQEQHSELDSLDKLS